MTTLLPQPLFGRARELEQLHLRLDASATGNGGLALVSGAAGIGKTTLIETLAREASERDMLVLTGGCYDLTATPPYGPWIEILRDYPENPDLPAVPDVLRETDGLDQVASQDQLFRIVSGFLTDITAATPVLLILEDLHWSDLASINLLRYLARGLSRQRILILASYRDDELTRSHALFTLLPVLVRESRAERLELQPFDAEALGALVQSRYPLSDGDARTLGSFLLQRTEGNPLFAAELLRSLERDRVLFKDEGGWRLGNLDEVAPPPLLVQMIERHLAALDPSTRAALEVAAVLGQDIDSALWQQLAGLEGSELAAVVEQALHARILEPQGRAGLRFRHALIREVLYHGMIFLTRQRVHLQAAEALAATGAPDADAIAYHFEHAGDERAIDWLIESGRRAARVWAGLAAKARYEQALRLIEQDETRAGQRGWLLVSLAMTTRDITARDGLAYAEAALSLAESRGDESLVAWALWTLGQGRCFVGENGLLEMQEGLAALRRLPPAALDRVPPHFKRFDLGYMESSIIVMQALFGYYRESLTAARMFLERFPAPESDQLTLEWGHALVARANALGALGDPEEASEGFQRTKEAYRKGGSAWYVALVATAELQYITLTYQTDQLALRKRLVAEAEAVWTEASSVSTALHPRLGLLPVLLVEGGWAEAREIATPYVDEELMFLDSARLALGAIARWQGEPAIAWKMVETGLPDGFDSSPGSHAAGFKVELYCLAAGLALDEENTELALRWIEAYDCWLDWSGRVQGRAESELLWARYHRVAGDLESAHRHARQALEFARDPRQPLALVAAYRMLGELDTRRGHHAQARTHLGHALDWAETCAAPYHRALALLALAELSAVTDDPDEAWQRLDQARTICVHLNASPALQRADGIASKLAVRRGKQRHPAGLTPREVDVLQLVARGMTDTEVAERLFLSPRTINSHLTSIYNKLGVNSRVAATRFAIEYGLTDPSTQQPT